MKAKNFLRWTVLGVLVGYLINRVLTSKKGENIKKDMKGLSIKISLAIAKEAEKLGSKLNKARYEKIVQQVANKYLKGKAITKRMKENLLEELKKSWEEIKKV